MKKGWISLHRQIEDNELWFSEPFTKAQAWIDLVLFANHKPSSFWVRGNEVRVERGQIGWSELTMAKRWTWSRNKVRRFLNWLETKQQIEQQKVARITTVITIIKYDEYQNDTTDDTTERQQKDNRRYTNNNDNNDNNDNKKRERGRFTPPTPQELISYITEKGYAVDADRFIDFYASKGWMVGKNKMKDWKAAVRTWAKRNDESTKTTNSERSALKEIYG